MTKNKKGGFIHSLDDSLYLIKLNILNKLKDLKYEDIRPYVEKMDSEYRNILYDFCNGCSILNSYLKKYIGINTDFEYNILCPGDSPSKIILYNEIIYRNTNINFYNFPLSLTTGGSANNTYILSMLSEFNKKIDDEYKIYLEQRRIITGEYNIYLSEINSMNNINEGEKMISKINEEDNKLSTNTFESSTINNINNINNLKNYNENSKLKMKKYIEFRTSKYKYENKLKDIKNDFLKKFLFMDYILEGNTFYKLINFLNFTEDIKIELQEQLLYITEQKCKNRNMAQLLKTLNPNFPIYVNGLNMYRNYVKKGNSQAIRYIKKNNNNESIFKHNYLNFYNLHSYFDKSLQYIRNAEEHSCRCVNKTYKNRTEIMNNTDECEKFIYGAILCRLYQQKRFGRTRAMEYYHDIIDSLSLELLPKKNSRCSNKKNNSCIVNGISNI